MRVSTRIFFTARFAQDTKAAKGFFVSFVQILERFRLRTEPSPDGRLMNIEGNDKIVSCAVAAISHRGVGPYGRRPETEKTIDPINPVNPFQYKNLNSAEPTNSYENHLYYEEIYGHDEWPDRSDLQRSNLFCSGKGVSWMSKAVEQNRTLRNKMDKIISALS